MIVMALMIAAQTCYFLYWCLIGSWCNPRRNTRLEKDWINNISLQHPELDFDVIEGELANGIQKIVDNLNTHKLINTQYKAISWYGQDTIHYKSNGSNASWNDDAEKVIGRVMKWTLLMERL